MKCRKCLLRDMPEKEFYENMYLYIRNLPEDEKTERTEYENRLAKCRQCSSLLNGMCRECGCFVEMRAAVRVRHCPLPRKRW
ncbi:MAG TPA: hypothetical protein H9955_17455 [Candidatus Mediterraneibacter cottocaccae]|nr:hypothetical protein [Candidatus Mediterraneibacter cottocaccae]